jgi:outer membrane protein TolC
MELQMNAPRRLQTAVFCLFTSLAVALPASAQQPLEEFLRSARTGNFELQAQRASVAQARSVVDEARARLLPSANASGTYTRNEREVVVRLPNPEDPTMPREAVLTPYDQLEARITLVAPLIDLSGWASFFAAEAAADAVDLREDDIDRDVRTGIVVLWHQLVASRMLVRVANRQIALLEQNRENAAARVEVGVSPPLELARAEAELQRARQALAEAQLNATLNARNLENATGLRPSEGEVELEDDLHPERPLDYFMAEIDEHPGILAASSDVLAAERGEHAAWLTLAPTIGASFTERITNAAGFQGANDQWALGVTASWQLDFARPAVIGTRNAVAQLARIRRDQTRQIVETEVFESWQRVDSLRVRSEAARAQVAASRRASEDARARFETGAANQLDVIQADRDLFQSEILLIQADAELLVARIALRIRSGVDDPTAP